MEILTAKEVAKEMGVKVSKVHEYRRAGLIRMFRTGSGFSCTGKEFERFCDFLTEAEADLSTPEKIILLGQQTRNDMETKREPAGPGSRKDEKTIHETF